MAEIVENNFANSVYITNPAPTNPGISHRMFALNTCVKLCLARCCCFFFSKGRQKALLKCIIMILHSDSYFITFRLSSSQAAILPVTCGLHYLLGSIRH